MLGTGAKAPASGAAAGLPDGRYLAGFRANHLHLRAPSADAIAFPVIVSVTELTGSETFLHVSHDGADRWVALVEGVHDMPAGVALTLWLDPRHVYLFAEDGRLATPAPYAEAA